MSHPYSRGRGVWPLCTPSFLLYSFQLAWEPAHERHSQCLLLHVAVQKCLMVMIFPSPQKVNIYIHMQDGSLKVRGLSVCET